MMNSNGTNKSTPNVQALEHHLDDESQLQKMTSPEAEKIISDITEILANKDSYHTNTRQLIHKLDVGNGYIALGCHSLNDCLKKSFNDKSVSELYKEAKAARIEVLVAPGSPIGEIPKSVLFEVGKLKMPEDKLAAWEKGMATRKQGQKFPTATTMLDIVKTAYLNHAEISDSRVAAAMNVPLEEKIKKLVIRNLNQFKSDIAKLDAETQHNWKNVTQMMEELHEAVSKIPKSEPVLGKDSVVQNDETPDQVLVELTLDAHNQPIITDVSQNIDGSNEAVSKIPKSEPVLAIENEPVVQSNNREMVIDKPNRVMVSHKPNRLLIPYKSNRVVVPHKLKGVSRDAFIADAKAHGKEVFMGGKHI